MLLNMDTSLKITISQNGTTTVETISTVNSSGASATSHVDKDCTDQAQSGSTVASVINNNSCATSLYSGDNTTTNKLLEQLHEQYAKTDNEKSHNLIYTIASIIAIFTGYGYIYYHHENDIKSTVVLVVATALVIFILYYLMKITKFNGYSIRRDQVIIYNIRQRFLTEHDMHALFGKGFNPVESIKKGDILPDYYRLVYEALRILLAFTIVATIIRVVTGLSFCSKCCNCQGVHLLFTLVFLLIVSFILCISVWPINMDKYKEKLEKLITDKNNK